MYSSAQIVFLFDVNCLDLSSYSVDDVNVHIAAFKLCCLRLITELGAQTQNASDIRWASKFYDSLIFKPGKTNNLFFDFNRRSYDVFDTEISEKLKVSLSNSRNGDSANSTAQRKTRQNNSLNHTPCFILNKAIQEALKDYNWDLPDVSSPVNTRKIRNNPQDKTNGIFNAIVVFTKFPQDVQAAKEFTGNYTSNNPDALAKLFFEKATLQALEEAKYFRLFCIETSPNPLKLNELPVLESLNSLLGQFNGSLLSISSIVDCSGMILKSPREQVLQSQKLHLHGLGRSWFVKCRHCRSGRLRKPQPGPTLVWQSNGVQTEKILLEILVLQGRVSHEWQEMSVVGSARASSASHAAMASLNSQVMLCRQLQSSDTLASAVSFDAVLRGLSQFRLVLVLQLTCGGLGLLSPFLGGVGCLTVLSSSGLAQPPLSQHQVEDSLVALATKPLLSFTQAAIKKALNVGGGIGDRKATAAAPTQPSDCSLPPSFKRFMLEPWYRGAALPPTGALITRRNGLNQTQLSILHRAQRKCCPQLSHLAGATDSSRAVLCPTKSMLGISPDQATSGAAVLVPKHSSSQSRLGAGVHDGSFSKPAKTVSRALQLVNKSKIVTAQQKVKEQKNEEEELEVARERRAQQSSLRSQKSQAIMSSTLSTIQDTTNAATVIQSLIDLRDSVSGKSSTEGEPQDGGDVFGIAQTIINVAVMHVRSANETTATASTSTASDAHAADTAKSGMELREVLSEVMLSSRDISSLPKDRQLQQFQLHVLLHLETMWLMGYSSGSEGASDAVSPEQERRSAEREAHLEEILRLLRGITLHFNPSFTTSFLNQTVLANYEDTLPDVLTEVFEELNQPLPPSLAGPLSVNTTLDTPPLQQLASVQSSVHSAGSMMGSGGAGGTRGGVRRRNSNMAVVGGGAGRQVVVPGSRMARLTRATSEQQAQGLEKNTRGKSSVRRSLFDNRSAANSGSKLSQGAPVTPQRQKRRRTSDKSGDDSPDRTAKRMKVARTPREERKRRRSLLRGDEDALHPLPNELYTPSKRDLLASPLTPASRRLLSASKGGVLAPGTPAHLLGRSIASLRSCNGSAVVAESPELKGKSQLSGRRCATGRSSFYSGAQSRNCERARTSLLAQRLQSNCLDKVLGNSSNSGSVQASQTNSNNVSASNFLFSKIIASAPQAEATSRIAVKGDRRRSLRRVLDFDNVGVQSKSLNETSSPSRRLTRSSTDEHFSPVKTTISKTFPLGTPKKESSSIPLHNETHNSAERKSPCTPKRLMSDSDRLLALGSPSNVTPSKRVQFSLEYTPSKVQSTTCANNTPKSILKTPTRTPLRQATSKTPRSCITPSRRPSLQVFRTPRSSAALSPDLFSCGKSGASLFSPAKTPSKSPMKLSSLTPTKQRRSPLVLFDKSRSFFSPSKRFSRSPKEVLDRSDSPAKTRTSGRNDSKCWSVSDKGQHVALDHGLDVCDDVSQSDDKALYASGKVEKVPEINLQNEGAQKCLPEASTINGVFSSDSAIVVDTGNDTAALKYSDEKISQDLNSSQCSGNTNVLHEAPAADLIQNSNQEDALDELLEIFDDLIDQGVTGNEIPSRSLDTFVYPINNNETYINSLDMSALNTQSSEVQILASETHASDGVSMINESCSACDEKSSSDEYVCEPLLDIPAMLTAEQETIKTNAVWLDTEALDNSFSSPEIEINHADRDSVKKCILKRKGNQIDPEPSFRSNDGPALEETTATQNIEPNPSCCEENSLENTVPSNSVEKILCNSSAAKPGTSIASSELELGNMAYSNSLLPFKDSSNGGEKDIELLRDLVNFQVSNKKESSNQPNCTLLQERQEESDNNKMTKFPTSEILESNGDKSVDIPANAKMTSKQLSSSTTPSQKSRCKTQERKTEILNRETSSVDFSEVMKEMPPSPAIKSKSKKRKFSGRRPSSDAGCSFTVTAVGSQIGKEKEESERELHWKLEGRKPSRLRRPTSVRQDCKSRYLPTRKSSNAVSSYFESDDDFANEDDIELFTTSAGYKLKSKKSFENSEARKNKSEENERKRNYSKNCDEKEKLSAEKVKPEKENAYVEPTECSERRSRCNKRLINWSDSEEDIEEISNVDKKKKITETNSRAKKPRYSRRGSGNVYNSISSPSSGSVFSPGSLQCDQSLGVTPLQNVENFTQARRSIRNRLPTSYADFPSDDSELFTERSLNNSQLDDTPVSTSSQVKIDKYLSPVRRPSSDFKPPVVKERNSTSTPNTEIDWKQTKPARTREKLLDRGVPKPNEEFQEPLASVKPAKSKKKKGKKKSVKLKFKKSGDEYQVSRPDLSGSSLNTTASECHSVSQASCSESEEKKKKKAVKGKRDNSNNDSLLTPLRFTRHMSKDLSITPELFQKLVSASPNSKASKPCASPVKSPKRPLPNIKKFPQAPALTNVASLAKQEDNVWRVQSIQGSPTVKAFIRVGNSPSCSKSHLHLSSPSVSSMLHLSTSPLLSKQRSTQDPGNPKLKASNNHDLHASSSRHDRAQHSQFNGKDKNTIVRKLYNHDVLESKKKSLSSSEEDGPSLKRLRDRSPVKRIQRRASKKLYD